MTRGYVFGGVFDGDGKVFAASCFRKLGQLNFGELLGGDFLPQNTKFVSMDSLLAKAGVNEPEELADVDPGKLDSIVRANSLFCDWQELVNAAISDAIA